MRNFTNHEATAFISECLNTHPAECEDNGSAFKFAELHMDRDSFDEELQYFAHENNIPLDFGALKYRNGELDDAPIEVLIVEIPYSGTA